MPPLIRRHYYAEMPKPRRCQRQRARYEPGYDDIVDNLPADMLSRRAILLRHIIEPLRYASH